MWRLDLSSHILFSPAKGEGAIDLFYWNAALLHEHGHWMRWQSTSMGMLQTLLRRAAAITAHNSLATLARPGREKLVGVSEERPLWSFETGYEPSLVDHHFALGAQSWLDMDYAADLFFDFQSISHLPWNADVAAGSAISDAWRAASSFASCGLGPEHPGNEVADHLLLSLPSDYAAVIHSTAGLSLRAIWESACTLDELGAMGSDEGGDREEQLHLVSAKLSNPRYGRPWTYAQEALGPISPRVFRLLAFFAADPPMPFLGATAPMHWSDVYPPLRFVRACAGLRESPQIARKLASQDLTAIEAIHLVETATGLRCATWPSRESSSSLRILTGGGARPVFPTSLDFQEFPHVNQSVAGSLNALVRASAQLRSTFRAVPDYFVWPSTGGTYVDDGSELGMISAASQCEGLAVPLIQYLDDEVHLAGLAVEPDKPSLLDATEVWSYCNSVYTRTAMTSFLTGRSFPLNSLPPHLRDPHAVKGYADLIMSRERPIEETAW